MQPHEERVRWSLSIRHRWIKPVWDKDFATSLWRNSMVSGCATEKAAELATKDGVMTAVPFRPRGFKRIVRIETEGNYKLKHNIGWPLTCLHACCRFVMHTISLTFKRTVHLAVTLAVQLFTYHNFFVCISCHFVYQIEKIRNFRLNNFTELLYTIHTCSVLGIYVIFVIEETTKQSKALSLSKYKKSHDTVKLPKYPKLPPPHLYSCWVTPSFSNSQWTVAVKTKHALKRIWLHLRFAEIKDNTNIFLFRI